MENLNPRSVLPKIVAGIVIVVLFVVLAIFGWHRFLQWHEAEVEIAVQRQQEKQEIQKRSEAQPAVEWLDEDLDSGRNGEVSEERMREVFGDPVFTGKSEDQIRPYSCNRLYSNIKAFFAYLDKHNTNATAGSESEKTMQETFEQTIADLVKKHPLINDETRDIVNLLRNQAHFFRVLDKQRLELISNILESEQDVLEPAMADFYDYYVGQQCCSIRSGGCIPEESLYEYASFFLQTLSGKSYLMRRHPVVRTLVRYYSLLILDCANDKGLNRHGIDIRSHIQLVLNEVSGRDDLMFRQRYIQELRQLREKYSTP